MMTCQIFSSQNFSTSAVFLWWTPVRRSTLVRASTARSSDWSARRLCIFRRREDNELITMAGDVFCTTLTVSFSRLRSRSPLPRIQSCRWESLRMPGGVFLSSRVFAPWFAGKRESQFTGTRELTGYGRTLCTAIKCAWRTSVPLGRSCAGPGVGEGRGCLFGPGAGGRRCVSGSGHRAMHEKDSGAAVGRREDRARGDAHTAPVLVRHLREVLRLGGPAPSSHQGRGICPGGAVGLHVSRAAG